MKKSTHDMMIAGAVGLGALCCMGAASAQTACLDARVTASPGGLFESFGKAVAISGDTAIIGAEWDDENGNNSGSAYVFRFDPDGSGVWLQQQKLLASDGQGGVPNGDLFGRAVAIDGDTALVAATRHLHDPEGGNGSVYVFRYDPDTSGWTEEQELVASDGAIGDVFGRTVSLSGDVAVIGAIRDDDNGAQSGSAYVFRFDGSKWVEEQKLLASDGMGGDFFGTSVAISADIAVIGANGHDDACPADPTCNSGAAYVFRFDPKTAKWSEQQKLLASDAEAQDFFGESVAVSEDVVVIGAPFDEDSGSAYIFRFDAKTSTWIEKHKILASDGQGGDQFGRAVAIDGQRAVVGAWLHDDVGSSSGAAYVFGYDPDSSTWTEQYKLLPQPNAWTQFFGYSVAIDGDKVIAGAYGEDQQRGAAYVFDVALNCNCPQDLDADGSVGVPDLLWLLGSWGPCPPKGDCPADFDASGAVGVKDLLILIGNWGMCP